MLSACEDSLSASNSDPTKPRDARDGANRYTSSRQIQRQRREKLLAVGLQVEVATGKQSYCKRRRGFRRPSFEVLAVHVRIVGSAIGANRTIERRFFGVGVMAVDSGILAQCR